MRPFLCPLLYHPAMNYQLNLYTAPWSSPAQADALAFARALSAGDHRLVRVFFFMDAVYTGLVSQAPASDEADWRQDWIAVQQDTGCELCCVSPHRPTVAC